MSKIKLLALAEKCAVAGRGSHDLDADIYEALGYSVIRSPRAPRGIYWRFRGTGKLDNMYRSHWEAQQHFTLSVDCALKLVPPRSSVVLDSAGWYASVEGYAANAATPALALCAAALRARAAQESAS